MGAFRAGIYFCGGWVSLSTLRAFVCGGKLEFLRKFFSYAGENMVTFSYQKHVGLWKSVDGTEAERAIAGDIDDSVNSKHIAQAVFCH